MKHYKVFVQTDARDDLRKCIDYLLYVKKNRQAAQNQHIVGTNDLPVGFEIKTNTSIFQSGS